MSKYRHACRNSTAAVPHRRRSRDDADLPRRRRLAVFRGIRSLKSDDGRATCGAISIATPALRRRAASGLVLETPTWRANPDWGAKLGYDASALAAVNRRAVDLLLDVRRDHESAATPIVISGNLGPRGDGYVAGKRMSADEAADYHDRAGGDVRADRRRHGRRVHDELRRGGGRRGPRSAGARHARRDLVHGRNRWAPAVRNAARRGDRRDRPRDRRRSGVLHDQLRASDALRARRSRRRAAARAGARLARQRVEAQPCGA